MSQSSKSKTTPRPEWNCLPGYVAAGKLHGEPYEQFNRLGLKIDADALDEFLKAPVGAIEAAMFRRGNEAPKGSEFEPQKRSFDDEANTRHLMDLVYRTCCVIVMAERERLVEDENPST